MQRWTGSQGTGRVLGTLGRFNFAFGIALDVFGDRFDQKFVAGNTIIFFVGNSLNIIFGRLVDIETIFSSMEFDGIVVWVLAYKCIFNGRIVGDSVAQVNQMR